MGLAACSQVLGIEDTELSDQTIQKPALQSDWSCFQTNPPAAGTTNVKVIAKIFNFPPPNSAPSPLPNIQVEVCTSLFGVSCTNLLPPQVSDKNGELIFDVGAPSFNGYVRFTGPCSIPNGEEPCKPLRVYPPRTQIKDFVAEAFMLATSFWDSSTASQENRDTVGDLSITTTDCSNKPILGLSLSLAPAGGRLLYFDGQGFLSGDVQKSTLSPGIGVFYDVPPLNENYKLLAIPDGRDDLQVSVNLAVVKGEITSVKISP
jgi:hypothetical protein